jgi:hypothetical protein
MTGKRAVRAQTSGLRSLGISRLAFSWIELATTSNSCFGAQLAVEAAGAPVGVE